MMNLETSKSIGIIGCGNMGSALVENFKKKLASSAILIFDKDKDRQNSLVKGFQVQGCESLQDLILKSRVIIIAVKPQDIDVVLKEFKRVSGKLIISIAAGITLSHLELLLGNALAIIRAMPNLNALIGQSVTALSRNRVVSDSQMGLAQEIFKAVGEVVIVPESQMNAVTAISGSGPAFVAYLIKDLGAEALERVFVKEALNFKIAPRTANILARGTISGTRQMLSVNFDPKILIQRVSSKGGITEAGMKVFENLGRTEEALSEAIRAAQKRADELSQRS